MKLAYYGLILRKKADCLEKELIQRTTPGSRTRGRPKMTWIDNIKSWTGLSLTELTRKVEDRHQWRKIVVWPTLVTRTAKGRQYMIYDNGKECVKERYPHSTAKIRQVQHFAAISAITELLFAWRSE